jgi:hypothetical protein
MAFPPDAEGNYTRAEADVCRALRRLPPATLPATLRSTLRAFGVAPPDSLEDCTVQRHGRRRRLGMPRGDIDEDAERRLDQRAERRHHVVVRGRQDRLVETDVGFGEQGRVGRGALHVGKRALDRRQCRGRVGARRHRRCRGLDHRARMHEVEDELRFGRAVAQPPGQHVGIEHLPILAGPHIGPRPPARRNQAFRGEQLEGLAHHRPAGAEPPAQLHLARHEIMRPVCATEDCHADLFRDARSAAGLGWGSAHHR